ncbi:MAG: right-handed parallel beta-helix repeat-containing protein, partial [Planctomycetes bacterium]|nr:right-handed parallel beta-helix repeat-containing protein [Planctomycetota bacterium]
MAALRWVFVWSGVLLMATQPLAATIVVDGEGGGDFTSIQPAIDAAADGDTVLIAAGEYAIREPLTYRGKAIVVKGEAGAEGTVIRMAEPSADPERASILIFESGEGNESSLVDVTLTGGRGTVTQCDQGECTTDGGAILCREGTSPTFVGCAIAESSADRGGGLFCGARCAPVIEGCTFRRNRASDGGGAIHARDESSLTLTECRILENEGGAGAGVLCLGSASLTDCTIAGNVGMERCEGSSCHSAEGAGVLCRDAVLMRCAITGNYSDGGGGGLSGEGVTLTDCIVTGNCSKANGGGMYSNTAGRRSTATGCLIAENTARRGGGTYGPWALKNCTVTGNAGGGVGNSFLTNCIVWDNAGGSFGGVAAPSPSTYSCVEGDGVLPGEGNIDEDPFLCGWGTATEVFVDPSFQGPADGSASRPFPDLGAALQYDHALRRDSPCLGTGEAGADMGAPTGVCDGPSGRSRTIRLAAGTYRMTGWNLSHDVSLIGAGPDATFIEDSVLGLRTGARLSGVTVRHGRKTAGLLIGLGESPAIEGCAITENDNMYGGGGVVIQGGAPTLRDCRIALNRGDGGGGIHATGGSPRIEGCVIERNWGHRVGGGLDLDG